MRRSCNILGCKRVLRVRAKIRATGRRGLERSGGACAEISGAAVRGRSGCLRAGACAGAKPTGGFAARRAGSSRCRLGRLRCPGFARRCKKTAQPVRTPAAAQPLGAGGARASPRARRVRRARGPSPKAKGRAGQAGASAKPGSGAAGKRQTDRAARLWELSGAWIGAVRSRCYRIVNNCFRTVNNCYRNVLEFSPRNAKIRSSENRSHRKDG